MTTNKLLILKSIKYQTHHIIRPNVQHNILRYIVGLEHFQFIQLSGGLRGTGRVVDSVPKVKLANYFVWLNRRVKVYGGT